MDHISSNGTASALRVVLFVVWPEAGHTMAPLALARQLARRGTRVVFAGSPRIAAHVREQGFEFRALAGERRSFSVFSLLPGRWALPPAVDDLVAHLDGVLEAYAPDLVLVDSLYSALGIVIAARDIAWAQYETDLPRELEPGVPPPSSLIVPDGTEPARRAIRAAWAQCLSATRRARRASQQRPILYSWSMASYFPDALIAELQRRFGKRVRFDRATTFPPVARAPRLVFCPAAFDFARTRARDLIHVGPSIDLQRSEPDFPWQRLSPDRPLVYCAFGSQTAQHPVALPLLRRIVDVFARRDDYTLVIACHDVRALQTRAPHIVVTGYAPQLALLRRARLAITHGGFNTLKECVALGVPSVVLPWANDQARNAALLAYHGLGVALSTRPAPGEAELDQAVTHVASCPRIRASCERMRRVFEQSAAEDSAIHQLQRLVARARQNAEQSQGRSEASNGSRLTRVAGQGHRPSLPAAPGAS